MKTAVLFTSLSLVALLGCTNSDEPATQPSSETLRETEPVPPPPPPPPSAYSPPADTAPPMGSSPSSPATPQTAQPEETPPLGSATATANDQELKEKIQSALQVDPSLSKVADNVQIETMDGKVTLRGSASSEEEKKQITTTVQQMEGVQEVDNQLQVASR